MRRGMVLLLSARPAEENRMHGRELADWRKADPK